MEENEEKKDVVKNKSVDYEKIILIGIICILIIVIGYTYYSNKKEKDLAKAEKYLDEIRNDYWYDDDEYYEDYDYEDDEDDEEYYDEEYEEHSIISQVHKEDEEDDEYDDDWEDDYWYEEDDDYWENIEKFKAEKANIKITGSEGINGNLIAKIENNNDTTYYDPYIYVVYYNDKNEIISIDYNYASILKAKEITYLTIGETPEDMAKYEFFIDDSISFESDYYLDESYIDYEVEEVNSRIVVKATNNSAKKVDYVDFDVIYFDENGNILDIESITTDAIKSGSTRKARNDGLINYNTGKKVKYSSYKVQFNAGYCYDYDENYY